MTTTLQGTRPDGTSGENGAAINGAVIGQPMQGEDTVTTGSWFARHPAWPITAMLAGWPVWWLFGFSDYTPFVFAIPMAMAMYRWRATGTRKIRVPPGFGLWLIFLLVMVVGVFTLGQEAPGTVASSVTNRMASFALRALVYGGCTVILLFAGNLTERELPRRRLAWLLGLVGIYTVAGGLAGATMPAVRLTSPLALLVPQSIQTGNAQVGLMLHPATSQIQNFLGYAQGRPSAPFSYTNMWGDSLAILLPWLLVAWWTGGNRRQRWLAMGVFALALVPVVYSLDRGLWIGLGFAILYLAVRFAARGRLAMLGMIFGTLALVSVVILTTPLQSLIAQRLAHGKSNSGRTTGSLLAWTTALTSPIVGYGDTRHEAGSGASIAIGRTSTCHNCGYRVIGGDGQLQLMLISNGVVGPAFYIAFFAYGIWRYRRDPTPYGLAGLLVLWLGFIFMFVYEAVGPPLAFTMLAYALLWRNERARRQEVTSATDAVVRTALPSAAFAGAGSNGISRIGM